MRGLGSRKPQPAGLVFDVPGGFVALKNGKTAPPAEPGEAQS